MSPAAVMFIVMFGLLFLGVHLGPAMFIAVFVLLKLLPVTSMSFIMQTIYASVADFSYLSLPFFMICGTLMEGGGLSKRLVNFANSLIGGITGSYGMVTIIACMLFGAVSGSAPATVAAIGAIMIPIMIRSGYPKYYAIALVATAGGLGVIVPPSYPMVLYAVTLNNSSITELFTAGWGPAFVVGGSLMIVNYFYCRKHGIKGDTKFEFKNVLKTFKEGILSLIMPVIILGGIYSGIFSATESAVIATVYGLIIGLFVYKELNFKSAWLEFREIGVYMGGTMLCFAPAKAMGVIFAYLDVTGLVSDMLFKVSTNQYAVLAFIFIFLFIIGMFIQTTPAIIIFGPTLWGVVSQVGVDPVHFGLVFVLGLCIAFITSPVAANLFIASTLTGVDIVRITKNNWRFLIVMIVDFFIVAFIPQLSLMLIR